MSRTATALGIAAALGVAASLGAQTTTTADQRSATHSDKGREVAVTGCLARGSDGTYMLNNAKIDENASSARSSGSTATTTTGAATTTGAPSPTTTGTTGSSVGTTAASPTTTAGAPMSWKLEGGTDLERHVGHKIQVTGRTEWDEHSSASPSSAPATTTGTAGASSTMSSGPRLDVSSVKMISTSCQ